MTADTDRSIETTNRTPGKIEQEMARATVALQSSSLPSYVVETAKAAVLDWLACALAGSRTPAGRAMVFCDPKRRAKIRTSVTHCSAVVNVTSTPFCGIKPFHCDPCVWRTGVVQV